MFPYPVINCQGLSNLLGLLAVRLNELETALIYLQQNKNYSQVNGLSSSRSAVQLTNNMNCLYNYGNKFIPSRLKTNKHQTRFKLWHTFCGCEVSLKLGALRKTKNFFGSFLDKIALHRQLLRLKDYYY